MTAEQERAAIVKWLRAGAIKLEDATFKAKSYARQAIEVRSLFSAHLADAIERGDHLPTTTQEA